MGGILSEKITDINEIRAMTERRRDEIEKRRKDSGDEPPKHSSRFVRDCYQANERGDGILYQHMNRGKVIFNAASGQWMSWAGHHWEPDWRGTASDLVEMVCGAYLEERKIVQNDIKAAEKSGETPKSFLKSLSTGLLTRVKQLRSSGRCGHCLDFARQTDPPMVVRGDELDRQPWLLACPNGVVDLKTGQFRAGQPDDYLSKACSASWEGFSAPRPLWEGVLSQVFLGKQKLVDFFQRAVGMALVGETIEHAVFVLWGAGCNGKSLVMETIAGVLGDLAGPIPVEMLLSQGKVRNSSGPTPDLMALKGLRVAYASEADEGVRFSESRVKWLTGGDRITGRSPHDKFSIAFQPSHTLFLLTNSRPGAPGHDFAFWRRVHLIEFGAQFVENPRQENQCMIDKLLPRKLKAEASGVLAWLVEGCLLWQREGLNPPAEVVEATAQYRTDEDVLGQFIEDRTIIDPQGEVGATDLYNSFVDWFHEAVGKKEPTQKTFGGWMVRRFERSRGKPRKYYGLRLDE